MPADRKRPVQAPELGYEPAFRPRDRHSYLFPERRVLRVDAGENGTDATESRLMDVIQACVVATMRYHYHTRRLAQLQAQGRIPKEALPTARPPEDRDIRQALNEGSTVVVYPDPPISIHEVNDLKDNGIDLRTPMTVESKDLTGRMIGISVRPTEDGLAEIGLSSTHLQAAMDVVAHALMAKGATLAYGGDLREDGFTRFLADLVRAHDATMRANVPRLRNFLAWPKYRCSQWRALLLDDPLQYTGLVHKAAFRIVGGGQPQARQHREVPDVAPA